MTTLRFKTPIAGYTAPFGTPGSRLFGHEPGDVAEVESKQARIMGRARYCGSRNGYR